MKPLTTAAASGLEIRISNRKQPPTVAMSTRRAPRAAGTPAACRYSTARTSNAVIAIPHGSGRPNNRFSAIAEPMTSARVARRDRDLADDPEEQGERAANSGRDMPARQVPARHDAEFCSETLQQDSPFRFESRMTDKSV